MKLKQVSFSSNYLYLFILGIVISLSAFSCNESEEIILEAEPEPLLMKFVNESNYDLKELKMFSAIQLPNLASREETDFIKMDKYTSPYSAKINHKFQDTLSRYPVRTCGNEEYEIITKGKYTVVLTVELGYYDYFEGDNYEQRACLYLVSNVTKE